KKAQKKKKLRKKNSLATYDSSLRNYIPFRLTTSASLPVATTTASVAQPAVRPRTPDIRAARVPSGIHVLPIKPSSGNGPSAFTNSEPIDIPATNSTTDPEPAVPYSSDIEVIGLTGVVTEVSVTINGLTHSSPDDLDMLLVGPSG